MRRYGVWLIVGAIAGFMLIAAAALLKPHSFRGSLVLPPVPAPDFSLDNGQGSSTSLKDFRGRFVVLFFGYTACPDVCPTSLSEMKLVRKRLGKLAEDVQVILITVDPERDTPQRTAQYAASFSPDFIGLSGSEAELEPVWKDYGVYHEKRPSSSAAGYLVDHSAFLYVIDRNGNLRETFSFGTPVDDIVDDLRYLLKER